MVHPVSLNNTCTVFLIRYDCCISSSVISCIRSFTESVYAVHQVYDVVSSSFISGVRSFTQSVYAVHLLIFHQVCDVVFHLFYLCPVFHLFSLCSTSTVYLIRSVMLSIIICFFLCQVFHSFCLCSIKYKDS